MRYLRFVSLQIKRLVCKVVLGHRWVKEQRGHYVYTGCARCRRLKAVDQMDNSRQACRPVCYAAGMKKSEISAVMRHLNKRSNKKYGKAWRTENAKKAAAARWEKIQP